MWEGRRVSRARRSTHGWLGWHAFSSPPPLPIKVFEASLSFAVPPPPLLSPLDFFLLTETAFDAAALVFVLEGLMPAALARPGMLAIADRSVDCSWCGCAQPPLAGDVK